VAKRCLIVTYYFPPTGGGGVQRMTKLIKYLSRQGWRFSVITSGNSEANLPHDENLLGEIPDKVNIFKIRSENKNVSQSFSRLKSSFPVRWLSSLIFIPDRYKTWAGKAKREILSLIKKENFDIILISSPPYSLATMAADLTQNISLPVVLDMRDPWTTNPYKIYPSHWHLRKDRQIERDVLSRINFGVSAYASLIEHFDKVIPGFNKKNWRCISNGFDEEDFAALKPEKIDTSKLNIAFSGTFYSHLNNPEPLFRAIADLDTAQKEKICFHHIGFSNIALSDIAGRFNLSTNIVEWGYYPHDKCLNILSAMDAFVFILESSDQRAVNTIGGKVYEYIGLGKPILALVPEKGEAATLIRESNSGKIIDPSDTNLLKSTLIDWI
jgi:glycosyltransferase involved in cell wall biosynthesis